MSIEATCRQLTANTIGQVLFVSREVTFNEPDSKHTDFFRLPEFLEDFNFLSVSFFDQFTRRDLMGSAYANALFVNPTAL